MSITFDFGNISSSISEKVLQHYIHDVQEIHNQMHNPHGLGSDYLGWLDLPMNVNQDEIQYIKDTARTIRNQSNAFVVIGIGGSYLGSRAAIELLKDQHSNNKEDSVPDIYFVGQNMSSSYIAHLLTVLEDKEVSINVISKSGTTTEPAIAFRIFRAFLENMYGKEEARKRIYATTDSASGALKQLADVEGYATFVIPDNVGGRYSVLTPVGLLPMAVSGIDIEEIIKGANAAYQRYLDPNLLNNECYQYAVARNLHYQKGKVIELLVSFDPAFHYLSEWWKQLFGESEGKDKQGIFPASLQFPTDLHSLGQYVQDGERILFETLLHVQHCNTKLIIPNDSDNLDGLNYLAGKTIDEVNEEIFKASHLAHVDGGVPNLIIHIDQMNAFSFGELIYFFEKACAMSGYILGVNPFDQPGVEAYKKNMFALLGKPGYEKERDVLLSRLNECE